MLNGQQFNEKYNGTKFYTFTNIDNFAGQKEIYFTTVENAYHLMYDGCTHAWIISVPYDSDIRVYKSLHWFSTSMIVIKDNMKIRDMPEWGNMDFCLQVVKINNFLNYVKNQTEEICLEAINSNWKALKFVKEQTLPICLAAVQKCGFALRHVKDQTPELCLAAVKKNGEALAFVNKQNMILCLAAVKKNRKALKYVRNNGAGPSRNEIDKLLKRIFHK